MRSKTVDGSTSTANAKTTINADDHRHGLYALSPLALLILVLISAGAWFIFSTLQVTSTEQSVFGLLQIGVQLPPNLTATQVVQYMNGQLDRYQTIAFAIGWGVQIALLMLSFPPDSALLAMHRKYNTAPSASLARSASATAKWRTFLMWILIGGDILTDFFYVAGGHALFVFHGFLPSTTSVGVWLVAIVYPTAVCFITIFVGKYVFAFLDALIDRLRGFKEA